jgi:hypothetical protein
MGTDIFLSFLVTATRFKNCVLQSVLSRVQQKKNECVTVTLYEEMHNTCLADCFAITQKTKVLVAVVLKSIQKSKNHQRAFSSIITIGKAV